MNTLASAAAATGLLAVGIIYGTDVFCALVQRPALAQLDDAMMAAVMGRVHQYGDRRLPAPGSSDSRCRHRDGGRGGRRIGGPRSRRRPRARRDARLAEPLPAHRSPDQPTLTKAAVAHVTPGNARALQSRWDSIITARALLMAVAVAGLAACAATS